MKNIRFIIILFFALLLTTAAHAKVKSITNEHETFNFNYLDDGKLGSITFFSKTLNTWTYGWYFDYSGLKPAYNVWTDYDLSAKTFKRRSKKVTYSPSPAQKSITVNEDSYEFDGNTILISSFQYYSAGFSSFNGAPSQNYTIDDNGVTKISNTDGEKIEVKYSKYPLMYYDGGVNYMAFILLDIFGNEYPLSLWYPGMNECFKPVNYIPEKITVKEDKGKIEYKFELNTSSLLMRNCVIIEVKMVEDGRMKWRKNYKVLFE